MKVKYWIVQGKTKSSKTAQSPHFLASSFLIHLSQSLPVLLLTTTVFCRLISHFLNLFSFLLSEASFASITLTQAWVVEKCETILPIPQAKFGKSQNLWPKMKSTNKMKSANHLFLITFANSDIRCLFNVLLILLQNNNFWTSKTILNKTYQCKLRPAH